MDKYHTLSICLVAVEVLNDTDSSTSEEELELSLLIRARPRIRNYIEIVNEYSNEEFKSHFR